MIDFSIDFSINLYTRPMNNMLKCTNKYVETTRFHKYFSCNYICRITIEFSSNILTCKYIIVAVGFKSKFQFIFKHLHTCK